MTSDPHRLARGSSTTEQSHRQVSNLKQHGNALLISSAETLGIGPFRFMKSSWDACPCCFLHPNNPVSSLTRYVSAVKSCDKESARNSPEYFDVRSIELIESKIQAHSLWRASSLQITHCCYTVRNWSCSLQMQSICALNFSLTPAVSAFNRWMKKLGQGRKSHLSADNGTAGRCRFKHFWP